MAKSQADFLTNLTNFNVSSLSNETTDISEKNDEVRKLYYSPAAFMREQNLSTYTSLIRFIPYYKNPQKSILSKYVSWITNNKRGQKRKIDDTPFLHRKPRVIGDCFFACYNDKNNPLYNLRSSFNSNEEHTCLIQVIDDKQQPDLVGKIMLFQFKKTLLAKLKDATDPSIELQTAHNPFALKARGFVINIHQKILSDSNNKFANYDNCKFIDKTFGIIDENGQNIENDEEKVKSLLMDEEVISEFEKNEFKEWDYNTKKFVAEAIVSTFPDCEALKKIKNKHPDIFLTLEDDNTSEDDNTTQSQNEVTSPTTRVETNHTDVDVDEDDTFDVDEFNTDDLDDIDF